MRIHCISCALNRRTLSYVHTQRDRGELSFRLPHQGRTAAGADVSARLPGGCVRRACGRRVHGCRRRRSAIRRWQSSSPAACFRPASPWSSWPEASSSPETISWSWAFWRARSRARQMLRNWRRCLSGQLCGRGARCGAVRVWGTSFPRSAASSRRPLITIAQTKAGLTFCDAFVRGILCNFLVCIAVWMANAAKTVGWEDRWPSFSRSWPLWSRALSTASPICTTSRRDCFTAAQTGAAAEGLTWGRALIGNLLPVTLGNLVGGGLLVGVSAWYLYLKKGRNELLIPRQHCR